jgi:hypothetical protein
MYEALDLTKQKTSMALRYDSDGTVWIHARAAATLTAKTPVLVIADEYGRLTQALSDVTVYAYVGVPAAAAAQGDIVWLQIGGYCADLITPSLSMSVGHALSILDGAVADAGADYSGAAGQFAVAIVATTTLTTQTVMLVPERILTTT